MARKSRPKTSEPKHTVDRARVDRRPGPRGWLYAAILVAAGLLAFGNTFRGVFMGDDIDVLVSSPELRSPWPPVAPPDTTLAGRPVATFTFAMNYLMAPESTRGALEVGPQSPADARFYRFIRDYHATNLLIHLLAGLALFGVVRRTLLTPTLVARFGEASAPLAFAIALLWLVHPLQTASVTYLIQRVESLMGLFYLTTMYCVIRAAETEFRSRRWIVAAVIACALGMGTKEVMVTAPVFLALWLFVCRPDVRLFGAPRTLLAGLAATWAIVAWLASSGHRTLSVGFGLGGWTWWLYLRTQAEVIVHYLGLAFWPAGLVFHHAWLPTASWSAAAPEISLLAALGIGTVVALARRNTVGLLGAWFFLLLGPSSSILPIASEVAADHRMYLPLAAVVTLVVLCAHTALRRVAAAADSRAMPRRVARIGWVVLIATAVALTMRTRDRNRDYEHFGVMLPTIVAAQPGHAVARLLLAEHLIYVQRYAEAEEHLRVAIASPLPLRASLQPRATMHLRLGTVLSHRNALDEAESELRKAIDIDPDLAEAYAVLAENYLKQARARDAVDVLARVIDRIPDGAGLRSRAAWVLATSRDPAVRDGGRAVTLAERAVALTQGADALALDVLAVAHAEVGQFDRAMETVARAIEVATAAGDTERLPVFEAHRGLFAARRPVRTKDW